MRAQCKTLIAHVEDRARIVLEEKHFLHAWAMSHAAWLLNRCHVSNATGLTAHIALRGRPYKGCVCCFGESIYGLDGLQPKYKSQWRAGIWLGKDLADQDIVMVNPNEVVRCKAVRKTGEHWNGQLLLDASLGPWDMKRGVRTTRPMNSPIPELIDEGSMKPKSSARVVRLMLQKMKGS